MKVLVRPGKKEKPPKVIFEGSIEDAGFFADDGTMIISIISDDIYTKNATQRYTVILDLDDQAYINRSELFDNEQLGPS